MNFDNYKPVYDEEVLSLFDSDIELQKNLKAELESELEFVKDEIKRLNRDRISYISKVSNQCYEQFKIDALDEVGLTGHPKAEEFWTKAYDKGHSYGMSEVFNQLEDMADLVI